jgi:hypothetical protein
MTKLRVGTAALLLIGLSGCALFRPKGLVLPRDRAVVAMPAGKAYTPASDGCFVPKARMQDILDRLSERDVFK